MAPVALLSRRREKIARNARRGKGSELLVDQRLVITARGRVEARNSKNRKRFSLVILLIVTPPSPPPSPSSTLVFAVVHRRLPSELKHPAWLAPAPSSSAAAAAAAHRRLFIH